MPEFDRRKGRGVGGDLPRSGEERTSWPSSYTPD